MTTTGRIRIIDAVSHERLDDEVIAINLETGSYFAFDGAAADCWTLADWGADVDAIADALVSRYEVTSDAAAVDARAFVTALVEIGLAVGIDGSSPADPPPVVPATDAPTAARLPYTAPVVEAYEDLETLLLIDPIHEVDDAGWPMPAAGND